LGKAYTYLSNMATRRQNNAWTIDNYYGLPARPTLHEQSKDDWLRQGAKTSLIGFLMGGVMGSAIVVMNSLFSGMKISGKQCASTGSLFGLMFAVGAHLRN